MKKKYPAVGKLPRAMYGVAFQKKSDWQKDNCINSPSFGGTCRRKSTMEAVNGNSFIRCCSSPACKRFAALLAKTPAALSPKKSREKAFLVGIHLTHFDQEHRPRLSVFILQRPKVTKLVLAIGYVSVTARKTGFLFQKSTEPSQLT